MEAASAVAYDNVVGDRNERWRNVIIHEIAHQWFGNSIANLVGMIFGLVKVLLLILHYYLSNMNMVEINLLD